MTFRVTDIKEFVYCSRIPYYYYVQPVPYIVTFMMKEGKEQHEIVSELMKRRSLKKLGVDKAELKFNVSLYSDSVGLSGVLDLLVIPSTSGNVAYPIDFKWSKGYIGLHNRLQIAGYSVLVEECLKLTVPKSFIYIIPERKIFTVEMDESIRTTLRKTISLMENMILRESFPPPTSQTGKCVDCEFRNWCDDIE